MKALFSLFLLAALNAGAAGLFNGPTINGGSGSGGTGTTPAQVAAQISTNALLNAKWRPAGGNYSLTTTLTNVSFGSQFLAATNVPAGTYQFTITFNYAADGHATNDFVFFQLYNPVNNEAYADCSGTFAPVTGVAPLTTATGGSSPFFPMWLTGRVVLTNTATLFFQVQNIFSARGLLVDQSASISYFKIGP